MAGSWGLEAQSTCLSFLCTLVTANSFVKSMARQAGFVPLLLGLMRRCWLHHQRAAAVAAAATLTELCRSNHGNQEALAEEVGAGLGGSGLGAGGRLGGGGGRQAGQAWVARAGQPPKVHPISRGSMGTATSPCAVLCCSLPLVSPPHCPPPPICTAAGWRGDCVRAAAVCPGPGLRQLI